MKSALELDIDRLMWAIRRMSKEERLEVIRFAEKLVAAQPPVLTTDD